MMEKVFVDTDIVLDLLAKREPHYSYAAELFSLADNNKLVIYVSSLSFAKLNYILSKQQSAIAAKKLLQKFKTLVTVLAITGKVVELALASEFKDFEDALQHYCAMEESLSVIITRNTRDYKYSSLTLMTAEEFLKI